MTPVVRAGKPQTGGELYTSRLLETLPDDWDVQTVTWDDLGLTNRAPAGHFAKRSLEILDERGLRGVVLQDTVMYAVGAALNRRLRHRGSGPIIGFGQAIYPLRATSPIGQVGRFAYLSRYLRTCDGHIVVSEYVKSVTRRLGVRRPISVVYPGFDLVDHLAGLSERPAEVADDGVIRIATAGTYIPSKGQYLLVDAVRTLLARRPELRGRVVVSSHGGQDADRGYFDSVRSLVDAHGLNDVVQLHGSVSQADLWRAFEQADIFVFMARGEGLGMVVGEAMLLGCVPVVSDTGPMKELIEEGVSGVLAKPNVDAVAAELERLVDDPARITMMATSARRTAAARLHGWEMVQATFAEELDELVKQAKGVG
jgi:glycosyltransferase involved in cell wall biosynthesis